MSETRKYRAFISYSHRDKKWGDWLHKALESYRVPKRLVGSAGRDGPVPSRLFPIFRDREELPTAGDLPEQIQNALVESAYLIVICSPASAASLWVNEEILAFKRMGREDRILAIIVEGEPNALDKPPVIGKDGAPLAECFPQALKFKLAEDGELSSTRTEPLAADAREHADGKRNSKLKLIAGILGIGFDELKQRDIEAERRRKFVQWSISSVMLVIAITGSAGIYYGVAQRDSAAAIARREAASHHFRLLVSEAQKSLAKGDAERAIVIALEAQSNAPGRQEARDALRVLSSAMGEIWYPGCVFSNTTTVAVSHNWNLLFTVSTDHLGVIWDLRTCEPTSVQLAGMPELTNGQGHNVIAKFSSDDRYMAFQSIGSSAAFDGIWLVDLTEGNQRRLLATHVESDFDFSADGNRLVAHADRSERNGKSWHSEWVLKTGKLQPKTTLSAAADQGRSADDSDDGNRVETISSRGRQVIVAHHGTQSSIVTIEGLFDGRPISPVTLKFKASVSAAFSPDASRIFLFADSPAHALFKGDRRLPDADPDDVDSTTLLLDSRNGATIAAYPSDVGAGSVLFGLAPKRFIWWHDVNTDGSDISEYAGKIIDLQTGLAVGNTFDVSYWGQVGIAAFGPTQAINTDAYADPTPATFSPDGALVGLKGNGTVLSAATGVNIGQPFLSEHEVSYLDFLPDNDTLVTQYEETGAETEGSAPDYIEFSTRVPGSPTGIPRGLVAPENSIDRSGEDWKNTSTLAKSNIEAIPFRRENDGDDESSEVFVGDRFDVVLNTDLQFEDRETGARIGSPIVWGAGRVLDVALSKDRKRIIVLSQDTEIPDDRKMHISEWQAPRPLPPVSMRSIVADLISYVQLSSEEFKRLGITLPKTTISDPAKESRAQALAAAQIESSLHPISSRDMERALTHWAIADALYLASGKPYDDRATYARARKASIARYFNRLGLIDVLGRVWKAREAALSNR